jgi:hypothetical protein
MEKVCGGGSGQYSPFYTFGFGQCSGDRQPGRRSLAPLSCGPPPPPLNTYEGGRIFCLDLFVKGQFICDVQ